MVDPFDLAVARIQVVIEGLDHCEKLAALSFVMAEAALADGMPVEIAADLMVKTHQGMRPEKGRE